MIETEAKIKRWGRSFGIIIPMAMIKESNFGENEVVNVTVRKKKNPFLENFGILKGKLKKTTEEILNESDKEGWDE
jgi:antitoxin component of MazEF toxin-antitoxin module